MRVFKNLFGDGSKIHADEIVVGNASTGDTLSNRMKNFEIVARGSGSGIVVSIDLPINSTYLFLMGRDGAVYFIHRYGSGDIVVTPIVPFTTNLTFNTSGGHLEIDLGNRGRNYVLVRLS